MKLKGKMYDYLGHFRQEKYLREGHNTMAEPAATQEMIREKFGRRKRSDDGDVPPDIQRAREAKADLKRVADPSAKRFRKTHPDADIHDYEFAQRYAREHPDADADEVNEAMYKRPRE